MLRTLLLLFSCVLLTIRAAFAQNYSNEELRLMQLDRDFDKATAERGIEGWIAFFAPNGSMLSDTEKPTTGYAEIRRAMGPALNDTAFSLRWQPTKAEMMIPGVIGYTVGTWIRIRRTNDGKHMKSTGTYSTTWKKQPDGSWKIVLDTGNPDGPPVEIK
jgi:ketosteroid isomerase-like protein